jgi:hypothetical protein
VKLPRLTLQIFSDGVMRSFVILGKLPLHLKVYKLFFEMTEFEPFSLMKMVWASKYFS